MHIELNEEEAAFLRELLDETYRDMKYEIASTDNSGFKRQLRQRERALIGLLERVGGPLRDSA